MGTLSTDPVQEYPEDRVPGADHRAARPAVVPPAVRSWLYGIATAAAPLLGAYGIVADEVLPLWLALAAQLLATSTATAYRPTRIGIARADQ